VQYPISRWQCLLQGLCSEYQMAGRLYFYGPEACRKDRQLLTDHACCFLRQIWPHYSLTLYSLISAAYFLYGALVVTSRTCYGALQIVVLLLLLLSLGQKWHK